jgi:ribosomal protein S1
MAAYLDEGGSQVNGPFLDSFLTVAKRLYRIADTIFAAVLRVLKRRRRIAGAVNFLAKHGFSEASVMLQLRSARVRLRRAFEGFVRLRCSLDLLKPAA